MQQKQIRIAVLSNAGGCGKSTLATNLAYFLAQKKYSVALIDLDPQASLSLFCGLEKPASIELSISGVLNPNLRKDWYLVPAWSKQVSGKIEVCQSCGLDGMIRINTELEKEDRGVYALKDVLEDNPLPHKILIFDCPTTLDILTRAAIAAATHLLIVIQLEYKSVDGATNLLEWLYGAFEKLRLRPAPELLGIVPNHYDREAAAHRNFKESLKEGFEQIGLEFFPPIRASNEFKNSTGRGLPLGLYRPGHKACKDFTLIVEKISRIIDGQQEES